MPPIRVLIVDDSVVIRKLLCEALASNSGIVVAGTASNGAIALARIPQLNPDVITLDIEMPVLNGIETLAEIRKLYPKLPVIMFSALTKQGAAVTLEALSLGASDYATKPSNSQSLANAMEQVRQELINKIISLSVRTSRPLPLPNVPRITKAPGGQRIDILAIGTSTGGPNALAEVIPQLPSNFPVPVVIVQHMPPLFTRLLAERLDSRSPLSVREGKNGQALEPGQIWIAPGNFHMTVERHGTSLQLVTNQDPPENSCRPAVDPLFRSVARVFGANVLAVVLTGMGCDGALGAQHIRQAGGQIFIQDEASSVVWGMPGQVAAAGLADKIYPITFMAREIVRRVAMRRSSFTASAPGL